VESLFWAFTRPPDLPVLWDFVSSKRDKEPGGWGAETALLEAGRFLRASMTIQCQYWLDMDRKTKEQTFINQLECFPRLIQDFVYFCQLHFGVIIRRIYNFNFKEE
jgi:hypothetical protein